MHACLQGGRSVVCCVNRPAYPLLLARLFCFCAAHSFFLVFSCPSVHLRLCLPVCLPACLFVCLLILVVMLYYYCAALPSMRPTPTPPTKNQQKIFLEPMEEKVYAIMAPKDRDKAWKYRYSFRMVENGTNANATTTTGARRKQSETKAKQSRTNPKSKGR